MSRESWRLSLDPALTFSDLQAEIVATLIREGVQVHAFNQRTVAGILDMARMVGGIAGKQEAAEQSGAATRGKVREGERPRRETANAARGVYFEEWDGPTDFGDLRPGLSEIVEAAGGIGVFGEPRQGKICQKPDCVSGSAESLRPRPTSSSAHGAENASPSGASLPPRGIYSIPTSRAQLRPA